MGWEYSEKTKQLFMDAVHGKPGTHMGEIDDHSARRREIERVDERFEPLAQLFVIEVRDLHVHDSAGQDSRLEEGLAHVPAEQPVKETGAVARG